MRGKNSTNNTAGNTFLPGQQNRPLTTYVRDKAPVWGTNRSAFLHAIIDRKPCSVSLCQRHTPRNINKRSRENVSSSVVPLPLTRPDKEDSRPGAPFPAWPPPARWWPPSSLPSAAMALAIRSPSPSLLATRWRMSHALSWFLGVHITTRRVARTCVRACVRARKSYERGRNADSPTLLLFVVRK